MSATKNIPGVPLGELVWAKMKGYSVWPAMTVDTDILKNKTKKGLQQCRFFGSHDYGLVEKINIKPYEEKKSKMVTQSKTQAFKAACAEIEKFAEYQQSGKLTKSGDEAFTEFLSLTTEAFEPVPLDESQTLNTSQDAGETSALDNSISKPVKKEKKVLSASRKRPRLSETPASSSQPAETSKDEFDFSEDEGGVPIQRRKQFTTPPATASRKKVENGGPMEEPSTLRIGVIGFGHMAQAILKNLIATKHNVVGFWNRSVVKQEEHDFEFPAIQCPEDLVPISDVILCCVQDDEAARKVVLGNCGVLSGLKQATEKKSYVEMSSIDPATSAELSDAITSAGGRYLEGQCLGTRREATEGRLLLLSSGDNELYRELSSVLHCIARTSIFLYGSQMASTFAMMVNTLVGVTIGSLAEILNFANRKGISFEDLGDILKSTRISNDELIDTITGAAGDTYMYRETPLRHVRKNLTNIMMSADKLEQPMPIIAATYEVFKHSQRLGYGDYDASAVFLREQF